MSNQIVVKTPEEVAQLEHINAILLNYVNFQGSIMLRADVMQNMYPDRVASHAGYLRDELKREFQRHWNESQKLKVEVEYLREQLKAISEILRVNQAVNNFKS